MKSSSLPTSTAGAYPFAEVGVEVQETRGPWEIAAWKITATGHVTACRKSEFKCVVYRYLRAFTMPNKEGKFFL